MRVFESPAKSSGQLLDTDAIIVAQNIKGGFLVELQLQQGDRLYFSSLFRDMLWNLTKVRSRKDIESTFYSRGFRRKGISSRGITTIDMLTFDRSE